MARARAALLLLAACALAPEARGQAPAELVKDIDPSFTVGSLGGSSNPTEIVAVGSFVAYFEARPIDQPTELWRTDATQTGTTLVKTPAGRPVEFGGSAFFYAWEEATGYELWRIDGGGAPTLVKDIAPGQSSSSPTQGFAVSGGVLYFSASDAVSGRELWRSDGTEAGRCSCATSRREPRRRPRPAWSTWAARSTSRPPTARAGASSGAATGRPRARCS